MKHLSLRQLQLLSICLKLSLNSFCKLILINHCLKWELEFSVQMKNPPQKLMCKAILICQL